MKNKVVLYLMNIKGYVLLETIIKDFTSNIIYYVVIARDKNIDNDYYEEYLSLCAKNNIICYDRKDVLPTYDGYKIAVGWRWLINDNNNLIVTHDSLLPKYRGYAPLVNMLINGENHIGVTAFLANNEFDKGKIINQYKIKIRYPIKIDKAISLIIPVFYKCIFEILLKIKNNINITSVDQDESKASFSLWRDDEDYLIDWNQSSQFIKRFVDAVGSPYGKARTLCDNQLIYVEEVEVFNELKIISKNSIGKLLLFDDKCPVVVCGKGLIKITKAYSSDYSSILPLQKHRIRFK